MKVVDKMLDWENAGKTKLLSVGYSLRSPELLFRKIDDAEVAEQIQKLKGKSEVSSQLEVSSSQPTKKQPKMETEKTESKVENSRVQNSPLGVGGKSEIVYDDFGKIDLRIGTITAAEKVEKADKLLKLQVDLGFEVRTIVSGIAQHFTPESLVNKQVVVVANLAPRKMRGIESQGMILLAEQPDGKLIFVSPDTITQPGSTVR